MPVPGLSLVGLMDEAAAMNHLQSLCLLPDQSPAALRVIWQAAAAQIGPPATKAGQPDIQPIPAAQMPYVDQIRRHRLVGELLETKAAGAEFRLVEIAPLLAYQPTLALGRIQQLIGKASAARSADEVLQICLSPLPESYGTGTVPPPQVLEASNDPASNSVLITTRDGNIRICESGGFTSDKGKSVLGIALGVAPSMVHVMRYKERYYLHNGYHRLAGLLRAGVSHAPCLVQEVTSPAAVYTIKPNVTPGTGFGLRQLTGPNPPTLAHYAEGRAIKVPLRKAMRVIHLSWSEYMVAAD